MISIDKLVSLINNPNTAKEYSYVLLGKSGSLEGDVCYIIEKLISCDIDSTNLSNRETQIDNKKLNDAITYARKNGYNFISLGHTHPILPEQEKEHTLASHLSDEIKNREYIREAGLNLSLQDLVL